MKKYSGLVRARKNGQEIPGSPWLARKRVPGDVQAVVATLPTEDPRRALFMGPAGKPKTELLESTGCINISDACKRAEVMLNAWSRQINELRNLAAPGDLKTALDRIERWRADRVGIALGFGAMIDLFDQPAGGRVALDDKSVLKLVSAQPTNTLLDGPAPGVSHGAGAWARSYFAAAPDVPSTLPTPFNVVRLIDQLAKVQTAPEAWRAIPDFDTHLKSEVGSLDDKVRAACRQTFAQAWREVVQAQEAERAYAAALLLLISAARTPQVTTAASTVYAPTAGDRTVGELMAAYRSAKPGKDAVAPTRALEDFLGSDTPVKAVTRTDARAFSALVDRLPSNATKLYPKLTMVQAADAAERDKKALLSPASRSRYMTFAAMVWNWSIDEGDGLWATTNVFKGLAGDDTALVKRRGMKNDELIKLFAALGQFKKSGSYKFWAPALMLSGLRLSEACQLRADDVKQAETGEWFVDVCLRDAAGRLDSLKSVKNDESIRLVPIHPLVIKAGFVDFAKRRQGGGAERLFTDAKCRQSEDANGKPLYDWSHTPSKVLNKIIDDAVSEAESVVAHSLRHGFREHCEAADLDEAITDAIAGWTQKSVGRKYGERDMPLLTANIAKLDYGALTL